QPAFLGQYDIVLWIIVATALVILFLAAIINAFDSLIHKESTEKLVEKHYIAALLLGLAAPIGGLYLNRTIAFPVDFQSTSVYVLTVFNGLILLLKPGQTHYHSLKYFLRCVSLPFIFYFFLVFLPFLPLSLLAIIALGTGFLILTPLVLGLFQFRVTLHDYKILKDNLGSTKAFSITVIGLLILPAYFIVEAGIDRISLDKTLSYFYSHNSNAQALSKSEIERSARALIQLRDRKSDIQLPYISGFYNAVVFGDMVLPNSKISQTYKWLTNQPIPEHQADVLSSRGRSGRRAFRGNPVKPERNVTLEKLEHIAVNPNKSTIKLTLQNSSSNTHSLYVDQLQLPEGLFITGLRLKIENEWVNGRIFDRKTALWVFQKITEVRRDPAIIYYTTPTTLELRVYPFPANGIREVELDLDYHQSIDATLKIGNKEVDLNPDKNTPTIVSLDGRTFINSSIPSYSFNRKPYLYFVLDFSAKAKLPTKEYIKKIKAISHELGISQAKIVAANIASSEGNDDQLIDISNTEVLKKSIDELNLPEVGGLWFEQAIAHEILRINKRITKDNLTRVPAFVIIQGKNTTIEEEIDTHAWNWLIPDIGPLYILHNNKLSSYSPYTGKKLMDADNNTSHSILAVKQGTDIKIIPTKTSSIIDFETSQNFEVYNPTSKNFEPASLNSPMAEPNNNWTTYAELWHEWKNSNLKPSLIESQRSYFLHASRKNSVLLPSTAFIVVESASQWKILERKEGQSLRNHSALAFEEEQQTSEPPWWLLLAPILLFIVAKDKKIFSRKI
ncbi:MAG: MSEP-CTERM sorting domain-containing protein, partial [Exilibacterium sp.]